MNFTTPIAAPDLTRDVLGALWYEANNDLGPDDHAQIEFKASAYWQAKLASSFCMVDGWSISCEYSPRGTKTQERNDIHVRLLDQGILWPRIVLEAKRPKGNSGDAENQAMMAAYDIMERWKYDRFYVITTKGTTFRAFEVPKDGQGTLILLHDQARVSDEYQEISSESGQILYEFFCNRVQFGPPQVSAPSDDENDEEGRGQSAGYFGEAAQSGPAGYGGQLPPIQAYGEQGLGGQTFGGQQLGPQASTGYGGGGFANSSLQDPEDPMAGPSHLGSQGIQPTSDPNPISGKQQQAGPSTQQTQQRGWTQTEVFGARFDKDKNGVSFRTNNQTKGRIAVDKWVYNNGLWTANVGFQQYWCAAINGMEPPEAKGKSKEKGKKRR